MKIGVIGAGTMGQGIAKAFAQCEGFTVALCDIKQEWAEGGKDKIAKGYAKLVAKGKMTQEKVDAILAAITPGVKEDLCADCDLVVEAAFEDMKVKQETFGALDKICKPECIFASNTSSLSITEIGKGLSRPLIGMHFFNPADRMKLVEVIAGANTPAETVAYVKERKQFGRSIAAFQNTQFELAEMKARVDAAKYLVYAAAQKKQAAMDGAKVRYSVEAAEAKLIASRTASDVTRRCLQLFGGYGYTRDYPIERMMRDAKITEIYEGTSEVQMMVISGAMLK